eukprot:PhM_4_TR13924/c0_g1_i2/m.100599/K10357/MYO5; myosin V
MISYIREGERIISNKPHTWCVANNAYYAMLRTKMNQSILISGESGAGKTEGCKIVLKYFCALSSMKNQPSSASSLSARVNERLIQTSPILEAFGNAKTVRNDNSSRFGKFMQVQFSKGGVVIGMKIIPYLLEKSRVIRAGPDERVYHSFYQLLSCRDAALRDKLKLGAGAKGFKSVTSGACTTVPGVNDAADFDAVVNAMKIVGFSETEQDFVWRIVAAVLHLQNVTFTVSKHDVHRGMVADASVPILHFVARDLLQISNVDAFTQNFVSFSNRIKNEVVIKYLSPHKAADTRDTVCRLLYEKLFLWIVSKINTSLAHPDDVVPEHWIGLLDIFGFEDFEVNSFEQLCINLTNETLQRHYTRHTFERDRAECEQEGVDVKDVKFADNQPCLDLIQNQKSLSIFSALDEVSMLDMERAKEDPNKQFLVKITQAFMPDYQTMNKRQKESVLDRHQDELKKPKDFFFRGRLDDASFTVKHYAGDVKYNVSGFVEKNIESIKDSLREVLRSSADELFQDLLGMGEADVVASPTSGSRRLTTVAGAFRQNLRELVELIEATNPQWIRCIRPHPSKRPNSFDARQVLEQLTAAGVMETVRMRQQNFPFRMKFDVFWGRYSILVDKRRCGAPAANCRSVLAAVHFGSDVAQVGSSKIFMLSNAYGALEKLRSDALHRHVVVAQRNGAVRLSRRIVSYLRWRSAARRIQRNVRLWLWIRDAVRSYYAHLRQLILERHERQRSAIFSDEVHNRTAVVTVGRNLYKDITTEFYRELLPLLDQMRERVQRYEEWKRGEVVELEDDH